MKKFLSLLIVPIMALSCVFGTQTNFVVHANEGESTEIDNDYVQTVDFSSFNKKVNEDDELYQMLKKGLLNANKYALTTWFNEKKNLDEDTGKYYNLYKASGNNNTNEYVYRFPATQAFGIAVSLRTGIYDEKITGVSAERAKEIVLKLVTSIAYGHKVNGGNFKSWGDDWQAAHWAYYAGYTAWLYWDDLSSEDQALIKNMIIYEANRFCNQNAVYWKTADGNELYAGDSKIEEDGWNAELLNLAAQMFPKHENASLWEYRFIEYQLAAFAIPSMNTSNEIIHGRPAKDWVYGYNVNENGTVINHGIVHPTYNAASTGVNTSLVNSLLHEDLPLAAKYNLDRLYEGLTKVDFKVEDGYQEPGGTIYRDGSYEIYCPQGNDWGGEIYDVYVNIDVSALVYGYGDDSYNWAKLHLQKVLDQQSRHEDGHTYKDSSENSYAGGEEAISMRLGCAFMTYWLAQQEPVEFDNYEVNYPASELPPLNENEQRVFASDGIYVRDGGNGDTNYYPSDMIEVKKDGVGYYREGFIKYDLQDLNSIPEKAIIHIPAVELGAQVESANIKHVLELVEDDSWSEETITYNNKPEETGKTLLEFSPTKEGITLDVTEYVRKAYASDKKISFRIYSITQVGGDTFVKYGSPRQADLNMRPQMLLTYGDDANLSLVGEENIKTDQKYNVTLEGNNLHLGNNYAIEVSYDDNLLQLENIDSASENLKIDSIDKTYSNKATAYVSDSDISSKLANLHFSPVGKGTTKISVRLLENGSEVLTAEKDITISQDSLSGSFVSNRKPDTISLPLDDTTVQPTVDASANAARDEMDMKTYGANEWNTRQTFVKFPLPNDDMNEIDSISINFNIKKMPNVTNSIDMRFQYIDDNSWSEETLTWDTKPEVTKSIDGGQNTIPAPNENTLADMTLTPDMVGKYISVDITEKAKELISKGQSEISVYIYSLTYGNLSNVFSTKESADENIRPYISTTYKKANDLSLNLRTDQENVNRYEKVSLTLSAEQLADIENPTMDITFPEFMTFDKAESINPSIQVETVDSLKNSVRLKLSEKENESLAETSDLITLTFNTIGSGKGKIHLEALDEEQNILTTEKDIVVNNEVNKDLSVTLNGADTISSGATSTLEAHFDGLVPGAKYEVELKHNEEILSVEKMFAQNQNVVIKPIDANHFTLTALDSDKPYVLEISLKDNQAFKSENVTIALNDEENIIESTHEFKYLEIGDKTQLQELYNKCMSLNENDYTKDSWANLQTALKNAQVVLTKENATQEEVDTAFNNLDQAYKGLVKADTDNGKDDDINVPEQPNKPIAPIRPNNPTDSNDNSTDTENKEDAGAETGVETSSYALGFLFLGAVAGAAMILRKRKLENK